MTLQLPNDLRAPFFRGQTWKRVKNVSGVTLPPHSVVLISNTSCDSTTGYEIVFNVTKPNANSTDFNWGDYLVTGPIAIGVSDTKNEGYATTLCEPGLVRYDTGSPSQGQVWGPKHNQFTLSSGYHGFQILGGTTTAAGSSVVVARWIGVNEVLIKNGSGGDYAAASGPATYKVYIGTAGSETDSGMTLSCYNKSSVAFKDTKYGSAGRLNGGQVYAVPWQT